MLIRFVVKNFLSFRDETEFNMLSGNFKIHPDHIYEEAQDYKLLRTAAIYGANASGKSNFVTAIEALKNFVTEGISDTPEELVPRFFKLEDHCKNLPTEFEIEFMVGEKVYRYFVSFLGSVINKEWLIQISNKKRPFVIFNRTTDADGKTKINFDSKPKTQKDKLRREIYAEDLRRNQPFIFEGYRRNISGIAPAFEWFQFTLSVVLPDYSWGGLTKLIALNDSYREKANNLLKIAGTGIHSLEAEIIHIDDFFSSEEEKKKHEALARLTDDNYVEMTNSEEVTYDMFLDYEGKPVVAKLRTYHKSTSGKLVEFDLFEESDGTRRLIELIPAFIDTIENGRVYIIDEVDRSMHPLLIKGFMAIYLSSNNNLSKGQFIFTTHESNLLDLSIFRQDEIWFIEKDLGGASKIYSLSDFKPRYDKDIKKGYLHGMFGAIPFVSDPKELNWS